jgi:hypothetical protein
VSRTVLSLVLRGRRVWLITEPLIFAAAFLQNLQRFIGSNRYYDKHLLHQRAKTEKYARTSQTFLRAARRRKIHLSLALLLGLRRIARTKRYFRLAFHQSRAYFGA